MNPFRKLNWVSSTQGDPAVLADLDRRMAAFYSTKEKRDLYQQMVSSQEDSPLQVGSPGDHLLNALCKQQIESVLEVGCGSGWLYRHLRKRGFAGKYLGLEMADYVIAANRERHPEARWETGSVYKLPVADGAVDACFTFYVLEHTVYPEKALTEMLRVVRPGGTCFLAFPNFAGIGFLPSQLTGFTPGTTREKWRAGRWWDAIVTFYDSRARVRPAIRSPASRFGPFPVNTQPLCLRHPELMWPDIDAVYVADLDEVAGWGRERGLSVELPAGRTAQFAFHAFVAMRKPSQSHS